MRCSYAPGTRKAWVLAVAKNDERRRDWSSLQHVFDRKKCLKYVVVENPHPRDGNWLNQRLMNSIRRCEKVNFISTNVLYFFRSNTQGILAFVYLIELILNRLFCVTLTSAETDPHEGKRKTESMWPIFRYLYAILWKICNVYSGHHIKLVAKLHFLCLVWDQVYFQQH